MKKTVNKSISYFDSGYGCAEAVLMAAAEYKNIRSELIPRIATGLCGGMGKTNGMCGAVSGAVLAISMIHGRNKAEDSREALNARVQTFVHAFQDKFGSIGCTGLTHCDLSTDDGQKKFEALNMHEKCSGFVGEATRLVIKLL
ncbi:MAG: C-GCAxxG-C-C family protein [Bacteroidales bacterium]|nr:C-GCAxxG-C-C family protein [Bacteroidales bacterium]MCF8404903.1 C-GCAxxG-C-C family protein [Bacteroidales bacterium]